MDTIERLTEINAELKQHALRLRARANEISQMAEAATGDVQQVLRLVSQSFTEQVDTSLEFQQELVEILGSALEDIREGGEEVIGIEPEDAEQILSSLTSYRGMLDEIMANAQPEQRLALQPKLDGCLKSIKLVEELTLPEEEDEEGEDGKVEE